ncbi:PaaI family thioesterase [Altererythrobacter sp. ZODW24]|uniref:PaaI family thioesterase n=1 Tax=Altererythrobacter sp. ZODW24 TaxID=2185142 RepID=UPI000DF750D5|nr:PaaI family thioesterase [Altererythrobacter sp. ZODW24]
MPTPTGEDFLYQEIEDAPGWFVWDLTDKTRWNHTVMGPMRVRREGDFVRLRMYPEHKHTNLLNNLHGAATLSLIDISLFAGVRLLLDGDASGSVTLDLSTQFIGAGDVEQPVDAVIEVLRETRRLVFLRGLVVQEDNKIAAYAGTVRKPSQK